MVLNKRKHRTAELNKKKRNNNGEAVVRQKTVSEKEKNLQNYKIEMKEKYR